MTFPSPARSFALLLRGMALLAAGTGCVPATVAAGDDTRPSPDAGAQDPDGTHDSGTGTVCALSADPFAPAALEAGVRFLSSDALAGHGPNTPGDVTARGYIADAFRCIGLLPGGDNGTFQQAFTAPNGTTSANVIGYLPGSDPTLAAEVIMVGAHHDHLGTKNGNIYNGANDNASGAISLIAQAQALAALHPKRTIGFVAYGYEEHNGNCEGSEYYVEHTPAALDITKVKYVVNMDMVGTYPEAGELTAYGTTTGSLGRTIVDGLKASYSELNIALGTRADVDSSDFQAFADRHIPYVYFETWDDACYHQPCDDADRVDFPSMSRIAKLGSDVITALAN